MDRAGQAIRMGQLFTPQNCEIPPTFHPIFRNYPDSPQIGGLNSVRPLRTLYGTTPNTLSSKDAEAWLDGLLIAVGFSSIATYLVESDGEKMMEIKFVPPKIGLSDKAKACFALGDRKKD
jgi:hypothetical protein